MFFFVMMFVCNMLLPIIMLIAGPCFAKNPPKKINDAVGYRTSMSKKNMDTWVFAHKLFGKIWTVLGIVMFVVVAAVQIPFAHSSENTIGIVTAIILTVEVALVLVSIIPVERALKKTFDENGNRR